jgi:hypothetical protein
VTGEQHADTVRLYLDNQARYEYDESDGLDVPAYAVLASLDALLAENQRLRDALEGIANDRTRTVAGLQGWAREVLRGGDAT